MDAKIWTALNPLLTDHTRLAIVATLVREDAPLAFTALAERLGLTRGNLSVHARKLEESGLIASDKSFLDRKPITTFRCTAKGKGELQTYLAALEGLLQAVVNK